MATNNDNYHNALEWAKGRGLEIHPHIERKVVNDIPGLYATSEISVGTKFASIPKKSLLKPNLKDYPANTSNAAAYIHQACLEASMQHHSEFAPIFKLFDSRDYLREASVQYLSKKEMDTLNSAAPHLAREIQRFTSANKALIAAICDYDDKIDLEMCELVTLNYASRAMTDQGFVPILDCFNHNDVIGSGIGSDDERLVLEARKTYLAGEQLFVTYGILDLFKHAISYNYFDPNGSHYIPLKRFSIPITSNHANQLLVNNVDNYNVTPTANPQFSTINQPNAYFSTDGPSEQAIKILILICGSTTKAKTLTNALLDQLDIQNTVHQHSKREFKGRIMRFYNVLQKEKQIIAASKNWLKKNL